MNAHVVSFDEHWLITSDLTMSPKGHGGSLNFIENIPIFEIIDINISAAGEGF